MDPNDLSADQLETVELGDYLRVIRERKWIIILAVAVVVVAALAVSLLTTPKYRASSQLLYKVSNLDVTLFGSPAFQVRDQSRELQTGAGMVRLNVVAQAVADELGSTRTVEQLLAMVEVRPDAQTNFINVTATSIYSDEAADIANTFARKFVEFRRDADRTAVAEARDLVRNEIDSLTPTEAASPYGTQLRDKLQDLEILVSMQTGGYEIVQEATVPTSPFTPQPIRNGVLALAVGLVLGLSLIHI